MLNLKNLNVNTLYSATITLTERLASHVAKADCVKCDYQIEQFDRYLLLDLSTTAQLELVCQRCLKHYIYSYENYSQLALCYSEQVAEEMLSQYETVVIVNNHISLVDIITDELHLIPPQLHADDRDCDKEVRGFIN